MSEGWLNLLMRLMNCWLTPGMASFLHRVKEGSGRKEMCLSTSVITTGRRLVSKEADSTPPSKISKILLGIAAINVMMGMPVASEAVRRM